MCRWGHALRQGAVSAVAVAAFVAGAPPAFAQATGNTLTEYREVVQQGDYTAHGTGMLGTGSGQILITDVQPLSTVTEAFLYWVIVAPAEEPAFDDGLFNGVPIHGELIATGKDPCRDPDPFDSQDWHSFVYRADVTGLVTPGGNGSYTLAGFATGVIDPTGDPFGTTSTPPSNAGASLVILYSNPARESRVIALYDGASVLDDDFAPIETTIQLSTRIAAGDARTTYGVSEGQFFFQDQTLFNDAIVGNDDFDGSEGFNQDTELKDVTGLVAPGDRTFRAGISGSDCVVHFAQVFSAPAGEPVRPEPVLLTLTPATAAVAIGEPHTVTATVTDATGASVPDVLVRFDVTGSVTTEGTCTTGPAGQCDFTFQGPDLPGGVTITAYADVDKDHVQDVGEPTGTATAVFVVPPSTPSCEIKITYGGWIVALSGYRGTFGGNGKADANRGTTGQAEYQDHSPVQPLNVHGDVVAVLCNTDRSGTIFGRGTVNGVGTVDFRIDVRDVAEPGTGADRYRIRFLAYDSGDKVLMGGNVQVH